MTDSKEQIKKTRIFGLEDDSAKPAEFPQYKGKKTPWFFYLPILLLLFSMTGGVIWYVYYKKEVSENLSRLSGIKLPGSADLKAEKPSESEIPDDKDLQEAILLYNQNYTKAAKSAFEEIIQSVKPNVVKSFAMVFQGIIADEEGKFDKAIDYFKRAISLNSDNFYAHYNMAIALRHKGMFEEAMSYLETAKKLRPDKLESTIFKGSLQYETDDLESAEQTFQGAASEGSGNPMALYNLGMVYKKQGKMAEAKAAFLEALEKEPAGEIAYKSASQLGVIHAIQGDYPNAKFYFQKAIQLAPQNSKYYYNLALVEYKTGNKQEALKNLERAVKTGDKNIETYIYISKLYAELGDAQSAEAALRVAREQAPKNTRILASLADMLIAQAKWDEAITILNEVIDNSTQTLEKADALYNLGKVYTEIKDWESAQDALERSYKLNRIDENALIALGNLYFKKGNGHNAIELYKQALRINPDNLNVLKAQSQLYLDLGLLTEAELSLKNLLEHPLKSKEFVDDAYFKLGEISYKRKAYDTAITYFERSAKAPDLEMQYASYLYIAECMIETQKPSVITLENIEKGIALKPRDLNARLLRVRALLKDGGISSQEKAEEELTTIIETGETPSLLSKALTFRGIIHYKQGLYSKALDDFNRAVELDPSNTQAFENKRITAERLEREL
ncbi:MAG: tetratricopeptide repeat protein [Spirochaetia bacterium]|nr:tetratricopeptide repeat protein [Spirochaetia bacterium]